MSFLLLLVALPFTKSVASSKRKKKSASNLRKGELMVPLVTVVGLWMDGFLLQA